MAATTGQLGLVTPTQGTLTGTWGDTVNNGITEYTNIAIAGTLTLTGDGAVTLANTTGDNSASNITSTLTGAGTVTAQFAIVRVTGTLTVAKVVTGPSYSKTYTVVNAATGGIVTFKASGQTGVSVAVGESAFVYYNGTDYVKLVGTATAGAAGGSTTQVQYNSSGVLAGSANLTFDGTTLVANNFTDSSLTATRVTYAGTAGNLVDSANLTFDGTNLTVGGSATATRFIPSGSTVATNGMYLPAADTLGFSTASTERMRIRSDGAVGIGGSGTAAENLRIGKNITGGANSYGVNVQATVQSDVTSAYLYATYPSTQATAFTLGNLRHFSADQGSIGATSAITNQFGFRAESSLTGATNNYGFYGNIASGTGRYNLYMAGTADNYMAGSLGIGATPSAGINLFNAKTITGATAAYAMLTQATIASDVTSSAEIFRTNPGTQGVAFTLANLYHFSAGQGAIGAGSALTTQIGFNAYSSLTGATNNYGFYGAIASGTGRYNFYAAGTADNYFAGNVGVGTPSPAGKLSVYTNGTSNYITTQSDGADNSIQGLIFVGGVSNRAIIRAVNESTNSASLQFFTYSGGSGAERFRFGPLGQFGIGGATYGTSGQVLTSGGSGAAPTWTTVSGGGSAATPTALGTVYGLTGGTQATSLGYQAGASSPSYTTSVGYQAGYSSTATVNNYGSVYFGVKAGYTASTGTDNTFIGSFSGYLTTTGSSNVSVGGGALNSNTTASNNTAVGYQAGYTNATGGYMTAVGYQAAYSSTGNFTTAVGYQALYTTTGTENTAVGYFALKANTTGSDGTAVGMQALQSNTTGTNNSALGYLALGANTTGALNVAVGSGALQANTTASNNTAVGYQAGTGNTTGSNNSFFGLYAGYGNTTGSYNTAIGRVSLYTNTTGEYNTAVGTEALRSNTTASSNTAVGYQAGYSNTTGASNSAIGNAALYANTTGNNNVVLGVNALAANTTSSGSAAVGVQALSASTGAENSGFGYRAGFSITSGYNNTCVGKESGQVLTTGIGGTYLGALSTASSSSVNYEIVISDGGGTRTGKGSSTAFISANNGGAYQGNNSATWSVTSDQRLKKNIVDNTVGLDAITSIRVRNFEYRLPEEVDAELKSTDAVIRSGIQLGVIAQELQAVLPDCVKTESTGVMTVDQDNLTWYMINAIKELKAEFDAYKLTHP